MPASSIPKTRIRAHTLIAAAIILAGFPAHAGDKVMTGIDYVVSFRELQGQAVTISDCIVGGTTADFIRCDVPNGSASYSLDTDTMDRTNLRWIFTTCPDGSGKKPECRIKIEGTSIGRAVPRLANVRIAK